MNKILHNTLFGITIIIAIPVFIIIVLSLSLHISVFIAPILTKGIVSKVLSDEHLPDSYYADYTERCRENGWVVEQKILKLWFSEPYRFEMECAENSDLKTIDASLLAEKDGIAYEVGSGKPYTGRVDSLYDNGETEYTHFYQDGLKDLKWTQWTSEGFRLSDTRYIKGKKNGLSKTWDVNGLGGVTTNYIRGEIHGIYTEYHDNGQKKEEGEYVNGNPVGKFVYRDINGNIEHEVKY
jgi:antitoxin component YwqK of YwqJK toxin-antitoxin module